MRASFRILPSTDKTRVRPLETNALVNEEVRERARKIASADDDLKMEEVRKDVAHVTARLAQIKRANHFMLHPNGNVVQRWDPILMVALAFTGKAVTAQLHSAVICFVVYSRRHTI